jgi:hypothetical protein
MDGAERKLRVLRNRKCDLEGNECYGQEDLAWLKYTRTHTHTHTHRKKGTGEMLLCAGWLLKRVWQFCVHRAIFIVAPCILKIH